MDFSDLVAPQGNQQKPYWKVLEDFHRANASFPQEMSGVDVPTFAGTMNRIRGTQEYGAGVGADNLVRRASGEVDIGLHHLGGVGAGGDPIGLGLSTLVGGPLLTGAIQAFGPQQGVNAPQVTGQAAGAVAQYLGANPKLQDGVERFGESIPRTALDLTVGGLAGGIPGMAAASALSTYGETGSKTAAGISFGAGLLFPKVAEGASNAALRLIGAKTLGETLTPEMSRAANTLLPKTEVEGLQLDHLVASNLFQKAVKVGASQLGQFGLMEGTDAAQILAREEPWDQKLTDLGEMVTPESLAVGALSTLPWSVVEAAHERGGPAARFDRQMVPQIKDAFRQRFGPAFEQDYKRPPTASELQHAIDVKVTGKPIPEDNVGRTLASMGEAPVGLDLKRPVKTSEGEINILDAVEQVRNWSNLVSSGMGVDAPTVGTKHDPRIATAIRDVEAGGQGKLTKEELVKQAGLRVIDGIRNDTEVMTRISPQFADLEKSADRLQRKEEGKQQVEAEITKKITPTSQDFDPELAKRVAVVSGTPDKHWVDAGLPTIEGQGLHGAPVAVAAPLEVSTRNAANPAETFKLSSSILDHIQSFSVKDEVTGQMVAPNPLSGDATFAARKAALLYDKPLDWSNPSQVRDFYEYVKGAVRNEEVEFQRLRRSSEVVSTHTNEIDAKTTAQNLQEQAKANKESDAYKVVKGGENQWNVVKQTFFSRYSLNQLEESAGHDMPEMTALQEKLELGGIAKPTLDRLGQVMRDLERNEVQDQFKAYDKVADPGTREGRRAAFAQTVADYITGLPDSKLKELLLGDRVFTETGKRASVQNISMVKARFVKFVQYLRDGGEVNLKVEKQPDGSYKVKPEGDLHAMNAYFGELGHKGYTEGSRNVPFMSENAQGMNFFEQFHVVTKLLRQELADPRWTDQRPLGDYGFVPRGFSEKLEDKLTYDPPTKGGWATRSPNMWNDLPQVIEDGALVMKNRKGESVRLSIGKNPLMTAILEGTKQQLSLPAARFTELLQAHAADADPNLATLARTLTKLPFGANIRVGFGIAKDVNSKGYYHYQTDNLTGTGILLSPFSDAVTAGSVRKLDNPKDILPHFVHELIHAHTVFGYHNDPAVKAEVDKVWQLLKDKHDGDVKDLSLIGFQQDQMHALSNPLEMLAAAVNDEKFQGWLKKQPDTLEPLTAGHVGTTLWDRLMTVIKNAWSRLVGVDAAGTMLERVTALSQQVMNAQEGLKLRLGLKHTGDIYDAVSRNLMREGDLIQSPTPEKATPEQPYVRKYPWADNPRDAQKALRESVAYRDMIKSTLDDISSNAESYAMSGQGEFATTHIARLQEALKASDVDVAGKQALVGHLLQSYENVPDNLMGFGKREPQKGYEGEKYSYKLPLKITWEDGSTSVDAIKGLNKPHALERARRNWPNAKEFTPISVEDYNRSMPEGQTLMSRVNPLGIVDSLKSYSDALVEDPDSYWFKPMDPSHFLTTFASSLGDKWSFQRRAGQWGYMLPKEALGQVTAADFADMPQPKVRPWATSAFETLKTIFRKNGRDEATSEALAGQQMTLASILRNDENLYGVLGPELAKRSAGIAWYPQGHIGLAQELGKNQVELGRVVAHEATHGWGVNEGWKAEPEYVQSSMQQVNKSFESLKAVDRVAFVQALQRMTDEQAGGSYSGRFYMHAVNQPAEFAAEFVAHTAGMMTKLPKPSAYLEAALRLVPDDVSSLLQQVTLARAEGLDGLHKAIEQTTANVGVKQEKLQKVVDDLATTFRQYAKSAAQTANDQAEFYRMRFMYPDMYQSMLNSTEQTLSESGDRGDLTAGHVLQSRSNIPGVSHMFDAMGLGPRDEKDPIKPSLWNRTVGNFTNFVSQYPVARPLYDMLASMQGVTRLARIQLASALAGRIDGNKLLDDTRTNQAVQFLKSAKLQDVFSKIALDMQSTGDQTFDQRYVAANKNIFAVDPVDMPVGYLDQQFTKYGLNPTEKATLQTMFDGTRNQIKVTSATLFRHQLATVELLGAKAIQRNTDLTPNRAREASKALSSAWEAMDGGDAATSQKLYQQFQAMVPDGKVQNLVNSLMQDGRERAKEMERFLSVRMPYWMTERRLGDYGVWWKDDDGKMLREYFPSADARSKYVQSKKLTPVRQTNPGDKNFGVDDKMLGMLDEVQDKMSARLKETFGEQEGGQLATMLDLASELRDAINAKDVTRTTTMRTQPETREDLNMFQAHQKYVNGVISATTNRQVRLETDLMLGAHDFDNQPILKNMLQQHVNNFLAPDTAVGRTLQTVNFIYYMGGNISSQMLHFFQQLQSLAPVLTERGDSWTGSYKRIAEGNKLVTAARLKGGRYADPELNAAINQMKAEGIIDAGPLAEFDHSSDLSLINRLRATGGDGTLTTFDLLKNRLYSASNMLRRFYTIIPVYNSEVTSVVGYKMAREQGMNHEDAIKEATFLKNQTMFGGGKLDRPIGLFSVNDQYGVGRTAAQAMWSLQTFENGMVSLFGNTLRKALNPKGLTPAQSTQVRKAALQMVTTQLVLAGGLGLPFVGAALTVLQKMFPETNPELAVRDFLNNLAGDDKALGGVVGSMLATGVPSAFDQSPDMGSRFALSGMLGVSPYSGIDPQEVFGPTGGLIKNMLGAVQAGVEGKPLQAVQQLMPRGFQRMFTALEQGSNFKSQKTGQLLVNDLSPAEQLERFVGYTPARVQRLRDMERLEKLSETAAQQDKQAWAQKQSEKMDSPGTEQEVQQAIAQRSQEKKGLESPRELAALIVKEYEKGHMPVDTRAVANKETLDQTNALKGVLGNQNPGPSYSDRVRLQQSIADRLGLGYPSLGQVRHASGLDEMLALHPWLTTPQASLLLNRRSQASIEPQFLESLVGGG